MFHYGSYYAFDLWGCSPWDFSRIEEAHRKNRRYKVRRRMRGAR